MKSIHVALLKTIMIIVFIETKDLCIITAVQHISADTHKFYSALDTQCLCAVFKYGNILCEVHIKDTQKKHALQTTVWH